MSIRNVGKKVVVGLKEKKTERRENADFKRYMRWKKLVMNFWFMRKDRNELCNEYNLTDEERKAIDTLYKNNYGKKVSYKWHKIFANATGNLDPNFIPLNLYLSETEFFLNPYRKYITVYENKYIMSLLAKAIGVKTPKIYFTCTNGKIINSDFNVIDERELEKNLENIGEIFMKPHMDSSGGKNCFTYNVMDGRDIDSGKTVKEILQEMGDNYVIQNVIRNHESISNIYSKSLNTFRIVTYKWNGDEVFCAPAVMRMGRNGSYLDNASSGGIYIAVEKNGQLHDIAMSNLGSEKVYVHPDSNIKFGEYKIKDITDILEAAKRMHRALPMVGIVNWDFAMDSDGDPVLIEANVSGGGIDMIQFAWGKGIFGEKTKDVLRWTKLMKKSSLKERKKHYFGV